MHNECLLLGTEDLRWSSHPQSVCPEGLGAWPRPCSGQGEVLPLVSSLQTAAGSRKHDISAPECCNCWEWLPHPSCAWPLHLEELHQCFQPREGARPLLAEAPVGGPDLGPAAVELLLRRLQGHRIRDKNLCLFAQ